MKSKYIFIDVETTGLDHNKAGVFQIAGIIETPVVTEEFNFFTSLFEGDECEESALKVNKMTLDKIMRFPDPQDVFKKFITMLDKHVDRYDKTDKFTVVGYFAEFDAQVLRTWFNKNKHSYFGSYFFHPWIDVANLAAYVYQEDRDLLPSFKLVNVAYAMALIDSKEDDGLHNALFDAKLTRQMYWQLDRILKGE